MQKALEIRKKDTRESCDGFLGIMLLYTEYGCHMHYRRILMKQFSKGIFLSVIAFSMVLGGGLFLVGPEGVQAVGVTGQPISSYFADPDLAELVATELGVTVDDALTQTMIDSLVYDLQVVDPDITDLTGISILSKLTTLNVTYTSGVTSVPEEVGTMTALITLGLRDLGLTELPDSLAGLTTLQTLDLEFNEFAVFPEEILGMTGLKYLWMGENKLTSLPASLGTYLPNLQDWTLGGNRFIDIPADTYNFLTNGSHYSEGAWYYGYVAGNTYTGAASNPAYVGQEYRMDCFPIFYQFLDFNDDPGMTFTLVYPDSTSVTFTPTFADGKMIVPAALITMAGTYTVQVADENQVPAALDMKPAGINEPNTSEFFFNNSYTQTFVASAAPAVSLLPQTGGFLEVLAGGSAILLGGVLLVVKSRRLN